MSGVRSSFETLSCYIYVSRNFLHLLICKVGEIKPPLVGGRLRMDTSFVKMKAPGTSGAAATKSLQSCPTLCNPIDVRLAA